MNDAEVDSKTEMNRIKTNYTELPNWTEINRIELKWGESDWNERNCTELNQSESQGVIVNWT